MIDFMSLGMPVSNIRVFGNEEVEWVGLVTENKIYGLAKVECRSNNDCLKKDVTDDYWTHL